MGEIQTTNAFPEIPNLSLYNGCITITSLRTGDHRTIRVKTVRKGTLSGHRIIELMTGPDNEHNFEGFGFVNAAGGVSLWKRYRHKPFYHTLAKMVSNPSNWIGKAEFRLEKWCRRCNIKLTNPKSIDMGIGPECVKKMLIK